MHSSSDINDTYSTRNREKKPQRKGGVALEHAAYFLCRFSAGLLLRVHARFVSPRSPRDISACARELFFFIILYNLFFFFFWGGALLQKRF